MRLMMVTRVSVSGLGRQQCVVVRWNRNSPAGWLAHEAHRVPTGVAAAAEESVRARIGVNQGDACRLAVESLILGRQVAFVVGGANARQEAFVVASGLCRCGQQLPGGLAV